MGGRIVNAVNPPKDDPAQKPAVTLKVECFEGPNGQAPGFLEFNEAALCRHIFACGSTGSGKTSLLRELTRQLVAAHAQDPDQRVGLVVLDFKGDATPSVVREAAAAVGREADVRVLSLDSDCAYGFFDDCRRIGQAAEFAERVLFGCGSMAAGDVFWTEFRLNMMTAALVWLTALHSGDRSFSRWISHAAAWLLADSMPTDHRLELEQLRTMAEGLPLGAPDRIALEHAVRLATEWDGNLDARTRSNARATCHNAFRGLLDESVLHIFRADGARKFRVASALEKGRILVVSISAFVHPSLASLVGKAVKSDWYKAVCSRKKVDRLAILICDEFQLVATTGNVRYDDTVALALLREKRAGFIACTQGLVSLDRAVGKSARDLLLANFNSVLFLRSTEAELGAMAEQICGSFDADDIVREHLIDGSNSNLASHVERRLVRTVRKPICPRGALARLQPGQAYIMQQNGEPCRHPIWFASGE